MDRDRLAPLPHLVAAVDVEDARVAQELACGFVCRVDERTDLDVLVDGYRDVLQSGRKGDDVLVDHALGD